MNFTDMLPYLLDHKKVRRSNWKNGLYWQVDCKVIHLCEDGEWLDDRFIFCSYDITAKDWEVIEED